MSNPCPWCMESKSRSAATGESSGQRAVVIIGTRHQIVEEEEQVGRHARTRWCKLWQPCLSPLIRLFTRFLSEAGNSMVSSSGICMSLLGTGDEVFRGCGDDGLMPGSSAARFDFMPISWDMTLESLPYTAWFSGVSWPDSVNTSSVVSLRCVLSVPEVNDVSMRDGSLPSSKNTEPDAPSPFKIASTSQVWFSGAVRSRACREVSSISKLTSKTSWLIFSSSRLMGDREDGGALERRLGVESVEADTVAPCTLWPIN